MVHLKNHYTVFHWPFSMKEKPKSYNDLMLERMLALVGWLVGWFTGSMVNFNAILTNLV